MYYDELTDMDSMCRELLAREIGLNLLSHYPPENLDYGEFLESESLRVLHDIQVAIQTFTEDDFQTVEAIVNIFRKYNLRPGACHDFG